MRRAVRQFIAYGSMIVITIITVLLMIYVFYALREIWTQRP